MTDATAEKLAASMRGYGKTWENRHRDISNDFYQAADCIEAQAADNARLREALAFYRDGFEPFKEHKHLPGFAWRPKEGLLDDCGETARAILAAKEPSND